MDIALAILGIAVIILLILVWLRNRGVKCRDCLHYQENYITSYSSQGLFRLGYCQKEVHDCRAVEPDIKRKCPGYEKKIVKELHDEGVSEEDTTSPLDAAKSHT